MGDAIVKLKRASGLHPPGYIQIVGTGSSRAYVWVGDADHRSMGFTTVNALRRAIQKHEMAQSAKRKSRR